jgi:hypothetical protein
MAVERRNPLAGRPLKGVPGLPSSPKPSPARPPARPARPVVPGPPVLPLVLWPALLTLGVTLLRLVGELRGWSPQYFSRLPGGGLAIVGISWLPPLVGAWLGYRLARAGVRSPSPARAALWPAGALAAGLGLGYGLERLLKPSWTNTFALWAVVSVVVAAAAFAAWPALGRLLLAYAYAARVPVAIVAAAALWRSWGTHYDVTPPGFPALPRLTRWLWIGLLPQATIWVAWTMATGAIFGVLGHWSASRLRR